MKIIMIIILKSIIILCTLIQQGYLQESHNFPPNSANGQYGTYPYRPSQVQIMNGNSGPYPRRHKKPCTRRIDSNDHISEDAGSQWIPTYASQTIKPLERNTLILKSRSLKDRNFNSNATPASVKVAEVKAVTEISLSKKNDKTEGSRISDLCVTSTTTEGVATTIQSDYKQLELDNNYYDVAENSNEQEEYEYDTTIGQSSEIISDDCNNKIEPDRNSRRILTRDDQILSNDPTLINEQSNHILKSNQKETIKLSKLAPGNNAVAPHSPAVKNPFESQIDKHGRFGLTKSNQIESNFDPTKGRGISHMGDGKVMLMQNTKVCYACSSVTDPTCWNPDRKTTVKYCRVGHDSCVTKTIRKTNELIVVRDCARSCDDTDVTGFIISRYKSCSICHYDLCNSAYSIKIYNFIFLSSLIAFIKHSL